MYLSKEGKKLYKYYSQYHDTFTQILDKRIDGNIEDDIYQFRITIKRLKGVIKLMDLLGEDFDAKKEFSPLKKLFKPAGLIRDCQVNLKRIKHFEVPPEFYLAYKTARKKCIKKHRSDFNQARNGLKLDDILKTKKVVKNYCKVLSKEKLYNNTKLFIESRINLIGELLSKVKEDTEQIHEIRIQLKEISVILGLLNTLHPSGIPEDLLHELKHYEDEIGQWHDFSVLNVSIQEFIKKLPPEDNDLKEMGIKLMSIISAEELIFIEDINNFVGKAIGVLQPPIVYLSGKIEKLSRTSQPSV